MGMGIRVWRLTLSPVHTYRTFFSSRPAPFQLEDVKQLSAYGIEDGAVLAHVSPSGVAASVDYARVSSLLQEAHKVSLSGAPDPANYYTPSADATANATGDWAPHWTRGSEWTGYPAVLVGGQGLPREDVLEEGGPAGGEEDDEAQAARFEELLERLHGGGHAASSTAMAVEDGLGSGMKPPGTGAAAPLTNGAAHGGPPSLGPGPSSKKAKSDAGSSGVANGLDEASVRTVSGSSSAEEEGGLHGSAAELQYAAAAAAARQAGAAASAPTATDVQSERDRELMRIMLTRMRAARRSKQVGGEMEVMFDGVWG